MRYSTVLLSLLPACLAAPSLVPRGDQDRYSQLLSTIGEIGSATADLTEAVNAFDPSLFTVVQDSVKVAVAEGKVDLNTLVATYWAHDSCNFTATESKTIVDTLAGQIGPIQASLTALQNKVFLLAYLVHNKHDLTFLGTSIQEHSTWPWTRCCAI